MSIRARELWSKVWPFASLCVLTASRWIAADQWPQTGSTLRSEASSCAIASVALLVLWLRRKSSERAPWNGGQVAWAAFTGAALLAMPALGAALRGAAGEPFNRTAAMCFVPLVAAICYGIRSGSGMRGLGAPLAGVAGALFLFPLALPVDAAGWSGLLLPPLAVGTACGLLIDYVASESAQVLAAIFLAGGAGGLLAIDAVRATFSHESGTPLLLAATTLDLIIVLCAVLSLQRLGAAHYATRYLIAPIITVLEGMLLLHPGFSLRVCTGLVLMAGAAFALWRERDDDPGTHLFPTQ